MVTALVYKAESIESFKSINSRAICVEPVTEPREVTIKYRFETVTPAKPFLAINKPVVIIDTKIAEELVSQAKALRKNHFWFVWKMYSPSRQVVDSTVTVIRYCPSDLFLDGFKVANYGNGTVILMRRSENYSTTINIGGRAVSYAKLRLSDQKIVCSGTCPIERGAIEHLFETL